jgi:aspartate racemase
VERLQHAGDWDAAGRGCTDITMLVGPADSTVPLFDTTARHARAAAALSGA